MTIDAKTPAQRRSKERLYRQSGNVTTGYGLETRRTAFFCDSASTLS